MPSPDLFGKFRLDRIASPPADAVGNSQLGSVLILKMQIFQSRVDPEEVKAFAVQAIRKICRKNRARISVFRNRLLLTPGQRFWRL
jgi:hypothetical protein